MYFTGMKEGGREQGVWYGDRGGATYMLLIYYRERRTGQSTRLQEN